MDKILVNLFIPSVQESYDLFVPVDMEISGLIALLAEGVFELSNNRYGISGKEQLILRGQESPMNPAHTLEDYGVQDGAELVLL